MNGIDKIISKINDDSAARCAFIIDNAQKECDEIIAKAKADGAKFEAELLENAEKEAASFIAMANSGAAQISRQNLLAARVSLISDTLAKLLERMKGLPSEEYFSALIKLASENAMKGSCIAKLSSNDNGRLPKDFAEKLSAALYEKGAECTLSSEPAAISSGILLVYGDIEVNCSFDALIEEKSDYLKTRIGEILFQAVT